MRSSPGVDTTELRDQLFSCPDENLRTALHRSHGVKLSTITVADLLDEIKKLAVVRQSNTVNTLALMRMKKSKSNNMGILNSMMRQMKKQQNMTKLHHEEWCEKS